MARHTRRHTGINTDPMVEIPAAQIDRLEPALLPKTLNRAGTLEPKIRRRLLSREQVGVTRQALLSGEGGATHDVPAGRGYRRPNSSDGPL